MSALVESLMYVSNEANNRFVPWHNLGIPVEEALNSKEAIIKAGLDWNVDQRPIYDAFGKEIPNYVANTRDTDNSVLGIVTKRYSIVQNEKAFEFTDSLIEEGEVTYETAGSLKNGKTIWLLAKMPQQKILDDKFDPYICFTNSHDGSGSIKVCMTPIRVVCSNTLNLALSSAKRSWSTKHVGDIQTKLFEAKQTLGLANSYMKALDEEASRLAEVKVTDSEVEAVFDSLFPVKEDDSDRKKANVELLKSNLFTCYGMPDISQYRNTVWGVINAVTDLAAHSVPARLTKKYYENNWNKIIYGHPFVDNVYKNFVA